MLVKSSSWLFQLKPWDVREASHQTAFMSDREPLVTRFTVLSTQWMKEKRTWGWSSLVWIRPVAWDKKNPKHEWRISCVLYRLQSPSWGRLKCQQSVLHELDIWLLVWENSCSCSVSVTWWSARENSTAESPVQILGGQNPNTLFPLMQCYYCWCGELMAQDKWGDEWKI